MFLLMTIRYIFWCVPCNHETFVIAKVSLKKKLIHITMEEVCIQLFEFSRCWEKASNLSKKLRLNTLASQFRWPSCLGRKTKIQIFTKSCMVILTIQTTFKIREAFAKLLIRETYIMKRQRNWNAPSKLISIHCGSG